MGKVIPDEFSFRWEIDNATATLATGKAESGVFNERGFKWSAAVEKKAGNKAEFTLRCDVDHNPAWKCEAELQMEMLKNNGLWIPSSNSTMTRFCFNDSNHCWSHSSQMFWSTLIHPWYNINETITAKFKIRIISSEKGQPIADRCQFNVPTSMSNVVLTIEGKKLHVCKEYLAVQSSYFETLFFGNFAENGKEEIELKDVIYEEFLDLLHYIHFGTGEITDLTVPHILKLADQFQMKNILELAKKYLIETQGIGNLKKLLLADRYCIASLRDQCLETFTNGADMAKALKSSPEYADFSADLKVVLCDRFVQF